nr:MAG TPA: hypothetical protein [Caudoviricetes sp.]
MVNGRKVRFLSLAGSVQSDSVERHANCLLSLSGIRPAGI